MEQIILFDGICNLCNGSVNYVIRHDPEKKFSFATLQSAAGKKLLALHNLDPEKTNSFILIQEGKPYTRSAAALMVLRQLKGPGKWAYSFIRLPARWRDAVYDIIASHRYKWFGKREECLLPGPDVAERFIDSK